MNIEFFETRPEPVHAVQWDGQRESVSEIATWIFSWLTQEDRRDEDCIEFREMILEGEDNYVYIHLDFNARLFRQSKMRPGEWLVLRDHLGFARFEIFENENFKSIYRPIKENYDG